MFSIFLFSSYILAYYGYSIENLDIGNLSQLYKWNIDIDYTVKL